jgi:ATP-dependent Zn protease
MVVKQSSILVLASLGMSILVLSYTYAADNSINLEIASDTSKAFTELEQIFYQAHEQLNEIDVALEELAQAINSKSAKVADKEVVKKYILSLRAFISKLNGDQTLIEATDTNVKILLGANQALIENVSQALSQDFVSPSPIDELLVAQKISDSSGYDLPTIRNILKSCDKELVSLRKSFGLVGLSLINRFAKNLEKIDKGIYLSTITKRLLPYIAASAYYAIVAREGDLPQWQWLRSFNEKVRNLLGLGNKANVKDSEGDGKDGRPKPVPIYNDKFLVVDPRTLFTICPAILMEPIIYRDGKDLWSWSAKQAKRAFAYAKGESFDDGSPIKPSKMMFKDIIGLEHTKQSLAKIVDYFKHKDSFDQMGVVVDRGYLFVGPVDTGKSLVQAVAGEITAELKSQGKTTVCGIYEVHASALLQKEKELKDIIKEGEKSSPCIILIDELDWLATQKSVDPKIWSDLVGGMTGVLRSAKKQVFIIATAQDTAGIDAAIKDQGRLGITLYFDKPSYHERSEFFRKELTDRCIDLADFNIKLLAEQTEGCSSTQLIMVMKRALRLAHAQRQTLREHHIELSINDIIYNVISQVQGLDKAEKQIIAAHYAGKALAHMLLNGRSKLMKVTILPVATQDNIQLQLGALITYKAAHQDTLTTTNDIEKECLIELAGLAAQEILFDHVVSRKLADQSNQQALTYTKQLVFQGASEHDLAKNLREEKLAQAWNLVNRYREQAMTLMEENGDKLSRIAVKLVEKSLLTARELAEL